ncbi:MAG: hypothetical protein AAGI01_09655 [Myxococcota bacterium]
MSAALISISPPERHLDRALLSTPGGFAWWYADMVNEAGDGVVMIWSFGLPFLPGLASAARAGQPLRPDARPSLNLAIYERGELAAYTLREFAPEEVEWARDGMSWRFGPNVIRAERTAGVHKLHAELDVDVPGSGERLLGTLDIDGVARRTHDEGAGVDLQHDWTPMMGPATGRLELKMGQRERFAFTGRAYHDRNGGTKPLHELGFSHWIWGRLAFPDREMLYYVLWPEDAAREIVSLGMTIDADGHTEVIERLGVKLAQPRVAWAGMRYHQSIALTRDGVPWLDVHPRCIVDNGPFYLRFIVDAYHEGYRATGTAERCVPSRVDRAPIRPFVRMRVQQPRHGDNSMWLPLFTGPRAGRLGRLLGYTVKRERRGRSWSR